ncbi:hypothetical protein WDU94_002153 [Cyamophila willieti]
MSVKLFSAGRLISKVGGVQSNTFFTSVFKEKNHIRQCFAYSDWRLSSTCSDLSQRSCWSKKTQPVPAGQGSFCQAEISHRTMSDNNNTSGSKFDKEELKKRLTPMQYHVTQEKGTERPFTGIYNKNTESGTYTCIVCHQALFSSKTKFDSGCGWPAFNDVLDQGKVKLTKDTSNVGSNLLLLITNPGMVRTEVTCSQCDAHLGHVFNDGPPPTKRRFCINSASIDFIPVEKQQ